MSTLRKMMGNELLGQILDNEIREGLFGHIEEEEKIDIIFSPKTHRGGRHADHHGHQRAGPHAEVRSGPHARV